MQVLYLFDSSHQAPRLIWMNDWMYEQMKGLNINLINIVSRCFDYKRFPSANTSTNICATYVQQLNMLSTTWMNHCFAHSMPNRDTHIHTDTHSCHQKPLKSATIPIPLWLYVLYRRALSTSHCMSQHFGMTLHHSSWKNNHQYSFCNRNLTMKWNQKWNTGFIPNMGCFTSCLAERES